MCHSGDALSNLLKLHFNNLVLKVLTLSRDLCLKHFYRVWLSVNIYPFSQKAKILRNLLGSLVVEGFQARNLLIDRNHFLVLQRLSESLSDSRRISV